MRISSYSWNHIFERWVQFCKILNINSAGGNYNEEKTKSKYRLLMIMFDQYLTYDISWCHSWDFSLVEREYYVCGKSSSFRKEGYLFSVRTNTLYRFFSINGNSIQYSPHLGGQLYCNYSCIPLDVRGNIRSVIINM